MRSTKIPVMILFLPCVWLLFIESTLAQDVEQTYTAFKDRWQNSPVIMHGGLQAQLGLNAMNGSDPRIEPFTYRILGHIQADILGIKVPAQLVHTSKSTVFNYTLPSFTSVGISPSYKWATLHLGDRSMEFSRYSLSGHHFRGIGMELKPGKFHIKSMLGTLMRQRIQEAGTIQRIEPRYKRKGWGFQMGYGTENNKILFSLFHAKDQMSHDIQSDDFIIMPAENLVLSGLGRKQLGENLSVELEVARSELTANRESVEYGNEIERLSTPLLPNANTSTGVYWAVRTDLTASFDLGKFIIGHERVGPGYQTMGSLFFDNDVERLTLSYRNAFLERKLHLATKMGYERNNLSDKEANQYSRFVGSLVASYTINSKMSFTGNYSNFNSVNRMRTIGQPLDLVDTITLALVNQQANLGMQIQTSPSGNFQVTMSWQKANNIIYDIVQTNQSNQYVMGLLSYNYQQPESNWSLSSSFQVIKSRADDFGTISWGPTLGGGLSFFNRKCHARAMLAYQSVIMNSTMQGSTFSFTLNMNYQLSDNQTVSLTSNALSRRSNIQSIPSFTECRTSLQYGWRF